MQDPVDDAADYQLRLNEDAVARHNARPRLQQRIIDGRVICLDCNKPVQSARLAACKQAALCVMCAYRREA